MKKTLLLLLLCLAACEQGTFDTPIGDVLLDDCGALPVDPGLSAAFETVNGQERVLMTRESYALLVAWREASLAWQSCASGHE